MPFRRSEILANREKAIAFLEKPGRRSARCVLDKGGGRRCCLGHMSYALGIPRVLQGSYAYGSEEETAVAPAELIAMLGLHTRAGGGFTVSTGLMHMAPFLGFTFHSLVELNDSAEWGPNRIGKYLRSVIEGGKNTPFIALSEYPE